MDCEYATCPMNSSHRILRFRMPAHIIKCKQNYQGPPLQSCPFNATHLIQAKMMTEHLHQCRDYHESLREKYERSAA